MPKIPRVDVFDDLEYKGGEGHEVEATETREFTVGGKHYLTYLSADNAKRFDEDLKVWTQFAEQVELTGQSPAKRRAASGGATGGPPPRRDREESSRIRAWARGQSFDPPVNDRGRIPDHITEAYYNSHPEERPAA